MTLFEEEIFDPAQAAPKPAPGPALALWEFVAVLIGVKGVRFYRTPLGLRWVGPVTKDEVEIIRDNKAAVIHLLFE